MEVRRGARCLPVVIAPVRKQVALPKAAHPYEDTFAAVVPCGASARLRSVAEIEYFPASNSLQVRKVGWTPMRRGVFAPRILHVLSLPNNLDLLNSTDLRLQTSHQDDIATARALVPTWRQPEREVSI